MIKFPTSFKHIAAATSVVVMFSLPAFSQEADLRDESALLERLARADAREAIHLDRQLRRLWSQSGSPAMDLLLERGREAMEEDDTRTAIEHLTALTDHAPEFAEGWHARASAYFSAELYGPALLDLERALALNPNNYNAIYGLGAMLETFGDKKRAYEAYSRVLAIHPHHEEVTKAMERLQPDVEGEAL
ncbi:MAG: tetratricopeptide repeat protein [Paracoccaceae bacterium]